MSTKKLAIISGKGGSGKTSIALAFSKILSDCNLRVLLVDCDMSTHGATFFMKPYFEKLKNDGPIISVDQILECADIPPFGFLETNEHKDKKNSKLIIVEDNFSFLPSDISISNDKTTRKNYYFNTFRSFIEKEASELFDIIIFDCQAGYSDVTRSILNMIDISLLVTEADSVSASANRALCFQMGIELDNLSAYQLFNKIKDEETIYFKGTTAAAAFFTNLNPISFSWEVRDTFVEKSFSSMASTSLKYTQAVLCALMDLFPEHKNVLMENKMTVSGLARMQLMESLHEVRKSRRKKLISFLIPLIPLAILLVFALFFSDSLYYWDNQRMIPIVAILLTISLNGFAILFTSERHEQEKKIKQEIKDNQYYNTYDKYGNLH